MSRARGGDRKPTPTRLKLLGGNPGKRPLNLDEPQPEPTLPEPPAHLSDEAKAEWGRPRRAAAAPWSGERPGPRRPRRLLPGVGALGRVRGAAPEVRRRCQEPERLPRCSRPSWPWRTRRWSRCAASWGSSGDAGQPDPAPRPAADGARPAGGAAAEAQEGGPMMTSRTPPRSSTSPSTPCAPTRPTRAAFPTTSWRRSPAAFGSSGWSTR